VNEGLSDGMSLVVAGVNLGPVSALRISTSERVAIHEYVGSGKTGKNFDVEDCGSSPDTISIDGAFWGFNALYWAEQLRLAKKEGKTVSMVYVENETATLARQVKIRGFDFEPARMSVDYHLDLVEVEEVTRPILQVVEPPDATLANATAKLAQMQATMAALKSASLSYALLASAGKANAALSASISVIQGQL